MRVAVVVGGAEEVWSELDRAEELCLRTGIDPVFLVTNDMISDYSGDAVGVTLHKDLLPSWLDKRRKAGFPDLSQIFCDKVTPVSLLLPDWGGSVSLYAVRVSLERLSADRVLLVGAPMTAFVRHYKTEKRWAVRDLFWAPWLLHHSKGRLAKVRSFSGDTMRLLGEPSEKWLAEEE